MRVIQVDENNQVIGNPFLLDMKLVCIEKQSSINFIGYKLTTDKIYHVLSVIPYKVGRSIGRISHYTVINDIGEVQSFCESYFKEIHYNEN